MRKLLFICIFMVTSLFAVDANLEIFKKANSIPKILISTSSDTSENVVLEKIKKLLKKDLEVSGYFETIKKPEDINQIEFNQFPDFIRLSNSDVDVFLNISAKKNDDDSYTFYTKLYDVNSQEMVLQKSYTTQKEERYPFLAHRTAISISEEFDAPSIEWMDKFVVFSVYKSSGESDIMIGDYTLNFRKTIVTGGLNIFPKWADNKQRSIYYTSYNYEKPTIVKLNMYTRQKDVIMQSDGMIVTSDVNANGSKLLITASPEGQPDIYLYDTFSKESQKVTNYSGIDVSAEFLEDDNRMVFVSDRLGYPNIFAKSFNSRGVERLVYHSRNNSSATAYKNNIVYVSRDSENELSKRSFNLYLISTLSDDLKRLTSSGVNQFPKFSKDGESLLYIKTFEGVSSLGIIRLNFDKSYMFPLANGRIQSIDW
ncbi:MAG: Tol-Pal system protein TolB [Campylobacterota bacterium]